MVKEVWNVMREEYVDVVMTSFTTEEWQLLTDVFLQELELSLITLLPLTTYIVIRKRASSGSL